MNQAAHYSVVIVGAGPTGLMLANLLGVYGVTALLLEQSPRTVDEPRAVTIDDESLRTVQATGLIKRILPDLVQGYDVHYYSCKNEPLARIEPTTTEYGYPKRNAFRQPMLTSQLNEWLQRFAHVKTLFGHALTGFSQDEQTVRLEVLHGGQKKTFTCDWLVACDGGHSPVREQLGIAMRGSTHAEKWLVVDLLERQTAFRHTRTYCDPARPAIRLPGPRGTLRYEFMLHEGEDLQQVLAEPQLRDWIRQREPLDAELTIARRVVYTFHARVAARWRSGRVFLAGDAAHLTPPFAGQGMNSGVRDAANLAWKLAAVVKGQFNDRLLASYEAERKPHAWALIQMAMRMGNFMQPKSRWTALLMQGALKLCSRFPLVRDHVLQLKFKPPPRFFDGFFVASGKAKGTLPAGQLMPQPWVELPDGSKLRLDDVLGAHFAALSWADATAPTPLAGLMHINGVGLKHLRVLHQSDDFLPGAVPVGTAPVTLVRDCDGVIGTILQQARADTVLLRPDRYVLAYLRHGEPQGLAQLQALLQQYGVAAA